MINLYGHDYFFSVDCEKAVNRLKAELDKHRWIPVEERLPKVGVYVHWVYESGYVISIVNLLAGTDMDDFLGGTSSFGKVTHWKPIILPEQALKGIKP